MFFNIHSREVNKRYNLILCEKQSKFITVEIFNLGLTLQLVEV